MSQKISIGPERVGSKQYNIWPLLLIDIHMKFCEDILKGFQVIELTHFYGKMRRKIIPRE